MTQFSDRSPVLDAERARALLCALGDFVRDAVVEGRQAMGASDLARVSRISIADTIYSIDTISEEAISRSFEQHWPREWPVELVAEGFDDPAMRVFPRGTSLAETAWRCVIDPIDGTRGIMYDKRPAWVLAGLAPQGGDDTRLPDIFTAAMTEIPTTKQWRADQISAVRGGGLIAEGIDMRTGHREKIALRPSEATDFLHGFASLAKFFPAGKMTAARLEEELWRTLYAGAERVVIFDDQYISTGGQFYELLAGHDRMNGDLRPMILSSEGIDLSLVCHPYNVCTSLLLAEAGIVFEKPDGDPVDTRLDLTSPVAWVAYANEALAELARPVLRRLVEGLPHAVKFRGNEEGIGKLAATLIRIVGWTLRIEIEDRARLLDRDFKQSMIWTFWHNRMFVVPLLRLRTPHRTGAVLTSASRDGAIIAAVMRCFGLKSVRGSSSRRGATALLALAGTLEAAEDVAVTPDGPRGPRYRLGPGVIFLARQTGAAILPIHIEYSRAVRLKSWDRFMIPLPFTKARLICDEPIFVAPEADIEAERARIEQLMQPKTP